MYAFNLCYVRVMEARGNFIDFDKILTTWIRTNISSYITILRADYFSVEANSITAIITMNTNISNGAWMCSRVHWLGHTRLVRSKLRGWVKTNKNRRNVYMQYTIPRNGMHRRTHRTIIHNLFIYIFHSEYQYSIFGSCVVLYYMERMAYGVRWRIKSRRIDRTKHAPRKRRKSWITGTAVSLADSMCLAFTHRLHANERTNREIVRGNEKQRRNIATEDPMWAHLPLSTVHCTLSTSQTKLLLVFGHLCLMQVCMYMVSFVCSLNSLNCDK